ncbi:11377_t:CDS:2, partial [Funneliformis geosporum]
NILSSDKYRNIRERYFLFYRVTHSISGGIGFEGKGYIIHSQYKHDKHEY